MANILIFDPTTKRVQRYIKSAHTPDFTGRADVLVNPNITNIDLRNSKVENGEVRNLTDTEKQSYLEQDKLNNYDKYRAGEYPPLQEQLDMLYKDTVNKTSTWVDTITAIKDKYPKPTR